MEKMLPLLFLLFLGLKLWAQEYRTVHCTDECEFVVHDTIYTVRETEEGILTDRKPYANKKIGLLRFGEVLSLDTTDFKGVYELDIPDFQDTDIYNLSLFLEYIRWSGCSFGRDSSLDTLYSESSVGWISGIIRCKEHGRFDDGTRLDEKMVEEARVAIFPIPVADMLNLHFSTTFSGRLSLLSLVGVEEISVPIHEKEVLQVDVQHLSGTYVLVLYDKAGKLMRREMILVL